MFLFFLFYNLFGYRFRVVFSDGVFSQIGRFIGYITVVQSGLYVFFSVSAGFSVSADSAALVDFIGDFFVSDYFIIFFTEFIFISDILFFLLGFVFPIFTAVDFMVILMGQMFMIICQQVRLLAEIIQIRGEVISLYVEVIDY